ncbi:DUF1272 domain-containing protein [bacterium]|nr:DUF1272 domain-containing protein [bacterium]
MLEPKSNYQLFNALKESDCNKAVICLFERTFCFGCNDNFLTAVYPHCGADLKQRPSRKPDS